MKPIAKIEFSQDEALASLHFALQEFARNDKTDLDQLKFGERVLTHRLGVYLHNYFDNEKIYEKIKVDCEYNRRGKDDPKQSFGPRLNNELKELIFDARDLIVVSGDYPKNFETKAKELIAEKEMHLDPEKLQEFILAVNTWDRIAGSLLNPDIVVHSRGTCINNLLAIEVKKGKVHDREIKYDKQKLRYFVSGSESANSTDEPDVEWGLGYRFGVFLWFESNGDLKEAELFVEDDSYSILHKLNQNISV